MVKAKKPKPKKSERNLEEALGPEGRKRLEDATDLIGKLVDDVLPKDASFDEYEQKLLEIANEIARRRLERKLQGIADSHPRDLRIEHHDDWHGVGFEQESKHEFRQHLPGTVVYHSLVGPLRVRRFTYRERVRNGVTYVPLELEAGLMERMTPGLAKCVGFAFSQLPIREVDRLLHAAGRCPPSRATLDRGAKDLGAYALACNDEIEPVIREAEVLVPGTVAVALGLDRTAVAMRGADVQMIGGRDKRRPRPKGAQRCRGKGVSWRMDYIATIAFLDDKGERIDSRQYRLRAEAEPVEVAQRLISDLRRALTQDPKLKIIVVQDGAPELWSVMREMLANEPLVPRWEEVLDWFHVDERLTACLDLSSISPSERAAQRGAWHELLLKESNGTIAFLRSLLGFEPRIHRGMKRKYVEHVGYFARRTNLLGYKRIRKKNLPIGSGVTEGACKSLVGTRAKRSGQHWTQRGLSAALHLRAMEQSGRFDSFWTEFEQRYRARSISSS